MHHAKTAQSQPEEHAVVLGAPNPQRTEEPAYQRGNHSFLDLPLQS